MGPRRDRVTAHPAEYWDSFPNISPEETRVLPQTFALWMTKPTPS